MKIPLATRKSRNISADDILLLRNINPMPWSDLDRWNYHEDPKSPTPPHHSLYTSCGIGDYFKYFWVILVLHTITNMVLKIWTYKRFLNEASLLNKIIHGLENCNLPFPWKDWDEGAVAIKDHLIQFKSVRRFIPNVASYIYRQYESES